MKNIAKLFSFFMLLGGTLLVSCQKDNDGVFNYPRLFSPIQLAAEAKYDIASAQGVATVSWLKRDSAISYTMELFQDSMQFLEQNLVLHRVVPATQDTVVLRGLVASTYYSVKLRANAADDTKTSKYNQMAFKVPAENIFVYGVNPDSVTDVAARIRWYAGLDVTRLEFTASGTTKVTATISAAEKAQGWKDCSGLSAGKGYTVRIFNEDVSRGTDKLRTADIYISTPGAVNFTTEFDRLPAEGGVIALAEGTYSYSTNKYQLPNKSVTIKGIRGGKTVFQQTTDNIFRLPLSAPKAMVKFESLVLDGNSKSYFINDESTGFTCIVGKIWFEGCVIKNFSSGTLLRFQNTTTKKVVDSLVINNCIINNISGSYAIIHNTGMVDSAVINNIMVTNSTIYGTASGLVQHSSANSLQVQINSCTFCDMLTDNNRAIVMYQGYSPGDLKISNCIFTKTKGAAVRGIYVLASTPVQVSNSYKASDFDDSYTSDDVNYAIPNTIKYSGTAASLFTNPAAGDFTIKDASFQGKGSAGDPRWRVK